MAPRDRAGAGRSEGVGGLTVFQPKKCFRLIFNLSDQVVNARSSNQKSCIFLWSFPFYHPSPIQPVYFAPSPIAFPDLLNT